MIISLSGHLYSYPISAFLDLMIYTSPVAKTHHWTYWQKMAGQLCCSSCLDTAISTPSVVLALPSLKPSTYFEYVLVYNYVHMKIIVPVDVAYNFYTNLVPYIYSQDTSSLTLAPIN